MSQYFLYAFSLRRLSTVLKRQSLLMVRKIPLFFMYLEGRMHLMTSSFCLLAVLALWAESSWNTENTLTKVWCLAPRNKSAWFQIKSANLMLACVTFLAQLLSHCYWKHHRGLSGVTEMLRKTKKNIIN